MRPLKLELEGFTAFRQRTCLDFGDLDLFAITGPTGAGKSSLIDAICYALYGRIPRVNTETGVCISLGIERMQVSLEFQANGRCYRVLRESRRKGGGNVRLEQLNGEDWQPLADRSREVNQKVEDIVGLDFEAFIRSALLPQGQFQEFLAGSPDRRRDVLDRLLRIDVYKRVQSRAGQEAQALQQDIARAEQRLSGELAEATPETLERRREELLKVERDSEASGRRLTLLEQGLDLARRLAAARQDLQAHVTAQESAERRLQDAAALVESGDEKVDVLRSELSDVRELLAANEYDDQLLASLTLAANLALNIDRVEKAASAALGRIEALEKKCAEAIATADRQAEAHEQARCVAEAAVAAFEEERRHDLAAAVQAGLKPGDTCPVCGGTVGELEARPSGLDAAQLRHDQARRAEESARGAAQAASTEAAIAQTNVDNAGDQLTQQSEALVAAKTELAAILPEMDERSLQAVQAGLQTQRGAREERLRLQKREADLALRLAEDEQALHAARDQLSVLAAECRAAAGAVDLARGRTEAAASDLTSLAKKHDWQEWLADLNVEKDPSRRIQDERDSVAEQRAQLLTAKGTLEEQVRRLDRDIETAAVLRKELAGKKAEHDVAADLALMLRADRFQAYLQAEALRSLAQDGSRRLLELSNGRYELEVAAGGQDFVVEDRWNSDEQRSVRTLSGGETFLASLALALSLAETLPGLAPGRRLSLESIFLDEGFGSLDSEALERAADALDALRGENRMVCVVTHLPELAQRLPARVVVTKTESGSSVAVE